MPKPNMTRLLGPPQDASEHVLTRCTVTGLSHATGPPPNHEYRHRRMSPGDRQHRAWGAWHEEPSRKRVGLFFLSFLIQTATSCFDQRSQCKRWSECYTESFLGNLSLTKKGKERICSWVCRSTWAFLQSLNCPDLKSLDSSKQILKANLYNVTCFRRSRECC